MSNRWIVGLVSLAAACGGGQVAQGVAPSPGPEFALHEFMAAVADSNLPKMAEFWGTPNGSAAETGSPPDYPKRIEVMQIFLRGFSYRVLASTPNPGRTEQAMAVSLDRGDCHKQVPFLVVKTQDNRWVIQSLDLNAVGTPNQPCIPG